MKFGRTLRDRTLKEWRFYTVDYKALKKSLKLPVGKELVDSLNSGDESDSSMQRDSSVNTSEFFRLLDESEQKLTRFYVEKERWAFDYMKTLEDRVTALREVAANPEDVVSPTQSESSGLSSSSSSSNASEMVGPEEEESPKSEAAVIDLEKTLKKLSTSKDNEWLKDAYRRVGASKHFHKSMTKKTGSSIREEHLKRVSETHKFLEGDVLRELRDEVASLIEEVNNLKPELPQGWENRKVYTIGCFDLFHRGHQNVLLSLREFGCFIVAGIHDDESYFKLKNKYTIDNLETRMENVKPFVDQLFVIPSTDPLHYIKHMVSDQDIATGACCYARGDDMVAFPSREWVESVMPVHFVPRTEACSSTLIRTIYHAEDEGLRAKAAFAKTRYDGKPVDEQGNVLKLKQ